MAKRGVLIADAGPLIGLSRIGSLNLLRDLFGQVLMTPEVRNQVLPAADFPDKAAIAAALDAGWLSVRPFPADDWQPINPGLGTGERSVIAAALRLPGCLLLIDDRAGRLEARAQGLRTVGTAAVIGMAKLAGQIPAARPILERLQPSGYFIGPAVIAAVLRDVGEG
jgi:predicted nucleic acid-binding protein